MEENSLVNLAPIARFLVVLTALETIPAGCRNAPLRPLRAAKDPILQRYTTPGTFPFAVPQGVSSISVEVWGAGGGGGQGCSAGGGGGGGGGYAQGRKEGLVPGERFNVTVGAGGTQGGARTCDGEDGGSSLVGGAATGEAIASAPGGSGGSGMGRGGSGAGGGAPGDGNAGNVGGRGGKGAEGGDGGAGGMGNAGGNGNPPGGGGGGGGFPNFGGGNGAPGQVVIQTP